MKWTDLYGLLATTCGWTVPEIDSLGMDTLLGLVGYWAENPPLHLMVKNYLGIQSRDASTQTEGDMNELIEMFGAAGGQIVYAKEG